MMPSGWNKASINDVCCFYTAGDAFEKLEYSSEGTPVLAKGDVKPFGRVEHAGTRFFHDEVARRRGYRFTQPGDLLLTTRDLTQAAEFLGLVSPVPTDRQYLINQGANVIRLSPSVDPRYFVYWCNGPIYRAHVKGHFVGSTQIHLRKKDFMDAPLWLPPSKEQRGIGEVLGELDDKIELNRQINETLEAAARAIFKSWFADFDPVRAKSETSQPPGMCADISRLFPSTFVDGIPVGWRAGLLGEVAMNKRVQVKPGAQAVDSPYIGLEHMPRKSIALADWGRSDEVASNKFAFSIGNILFGKLRPYFHKVGVAALGGVCSTDVLVVTAKNPEWFGFVLGHISSDELVTYADAGSTGTKMPRTNWHDLARYEVVIPTPAVAAAFNEIVRPMIDHVCNNIHESRTLAALRDTLLPKLLCGEIRLKAAEQTVGASV